MNNAFEKYAQEEYTRLAHAIVFEKLSAAQIHLELARMEGQRDACLKLGLYKEAGILDAGLKTLKSLAAPVATNLGSEVIPGLGVATSALSMGKKLLPGGAASQAIRKASGGTFAGNIKGQLNAAWGALGDDAAGIAAGTANVFVPGLGTAGRAAVGAGKGAYAAAAARSASGRAKQKLLGTAMDEIGGAIGGSLEEGAASGISDVLTSLV